MNALEDMEQTAVIIRDAIRDIPNRVKENKKTLNDLDNEIQDLLHAIEFSTFNAHQGWKYSKELKDARSLRRQLKNENELMEPLLGYLKKSRNYLGELDKVVLDIQKVKQVQANRSYRCRVRDDLQNKF